MLHCRKKCKRKQPPQTTPPQDLRHAAAAPINQVDLYALLGVGPCATLGEIKHAFKRHALTCHPDKQGCKNQFQAVCEAHEILTDTQKRQIYDTQGLEAARKFSPVQNAPSCSFVSSLNIIGNLMSNPHKRQCPIKAAVERRRAARQATAQAATSPAPSSETLPAGSQVVLVNLTAADYNGKVATIVYFDNSSRRYMVTVASNIFQVLPVKVRRICARAQVETTCPLNGKLANVLSFDAATSLYDAQVESVLIQLPPERLLFVHGTLVQLIALSSNSAHLNGKWGEVRGVTESKLYCVVLQNEKLCVQVPPANVLPQC